MSVTNAIKSNPGIKQFVHRLLIPKNEARPRLWVKIFLNPFIHTRGKDSRICGMTRIDVVPFKKFVLGKCSTIEDFCTVNNGVGDVVIGDHTLIGMGNVLIGPITIGDNVIFAQNVVASGLNHEYRDVKVPIHLQNVTTAPIVIEDDCWIAANVVITSGVTIGKHCVVAAGAVVTKDVPAFTIVAGNPAKPIRHFDAALNEWVRV